MEQAELFIFDFLTIHGVNTSEISDTGTVENIEDRGYSLSDISEGNVPSLVILDSIAWL